jgi:hypothetical protein
MTTNDPSRSPTRLALVLGAVTTIGCAGASSSTPQAGRGSEPETEPSARHAPTGARYALHEWGVVRAEAGDRLRLSAAPPPEEQRYFFSPDAVVEKPVIYLHVEGDEPITLRSLRVTADANILEHWPLTSAPLGTSRIEWRGVTARREHCASTHYPTASEPPCDTILPSSDCEALALASYEVPSSACLELEGGVRQNLLFYRSRTRVAPPLSVTRQGESLAITSGATLADTSVVWTRGGLASIVAAPAASQTIVVPAPSEPAARALEILSAEMTRRGLAEDEIATFWRAWASTLLGDPLRRIDPLPQTATEDLVEQPPLPRAAEANERTPRPTEESPPPAPVDVVFYFLPADVIDAMAHLEVDPPPSRVVRVFGVIQAPSP